MDDSGSTEEDIAVLDDIAYLVRSETRVHLLRTLTASAPTDRSTLESALDVDRTTVQRNLDGLAERGWVRERDEGWTLTLAGEAVLAEFEDLTDVVGLTDRLQPWLGSLGPSFDLDLEHLTDADLAVAGPGNPYAPVNRHAAAIEAATEMRLLLPSVGREPLRVALDRVENGGATIEGVLSADAAAAMESGPGFDDLLPEARTHERFRVRRYEGTIPYFVGIYDDVVQIGVEDADGKPQALVESTAPAVREWAVETYDRYERDAEPLF